MATTANEFGEIRRNLHVTTNWEIAVKEYEDSLIIDIPNVSYIIE